MMDLDSVTRDLSSENTASKEKYERQVQMDLEEKSKSYLTGGEKLAAGGKGCDMPFESGAVSEGDSSRNQCQNDEVRVQLNGIDGKIATLDKLDIDFKIQDNEDACNRKRKRESILESLDWVRKVAKDPCDQAIGSLPERSKWKYFGTEHTWKQFLLVRQRMMVKRTDNSSVEQSIWQKKQTMHPTMYEDHSRFSQRLASAKKSQAALSFKKQQAQSCSKTTSSDTQSEMENSLAGLWLTKYIYKKIPVGIDRQAEVPEWTETVSNSESKWLGTCIWPQEKGVSRNCLIERDPTGFGRLDHCSCEFQGSFECVKFHVSEERVRLKLELGVAFYYWQMDKMGEEVALSWNKSEELNFDAIVKSNPPSQGKCFWEEIHKCFHYKRTEQLVRYYFNVFLLRRRGLQNRSTLIEISSDDDELEFETTTNCCGQTAARSA